MADQLPINTFGDEQNADNNIQELVEKVKRIYFIKIFTIYLAFRTARTRLLTFHDYSDKNETIKIFLNSNLLFNQQFDFI